MRAPRPLALALWALPLAAAAEPPVSAGPASAGPIQPAGAASAPRFVLLGPDGKPHPATRPAFKQLKPIDAAAIEAAYKRRLAEEASGRQLKPMRALNPKILASIQRSQTQATQVPLQPSVTEWIGLVQRALRAAKIKP